MRQSALDEAAGAAVLDDDSPDEVPDEAVVDEVVDVLLEKEPADDPPRLSVL